MPNGEQQLDYIEHPVHGRLGFPSEMGGEERNRIIDNLDKEAHEARAARSRSPKWQFGEGAPTPILGRRAEQGILPALGRLGVGAAEMFGDIGEVGPLSPAGMARFGEKYVAAPARAEWRKAKEQFAEPGIAPKVSAAGHAMAAGLPFIGPGAATAGEELGRMDPGGFVTGAATLLGAREAVRGGGRFAGELLEPRRTAAGRAGLVEALRTPAGKGGVRAETMAADVDQALPHIAKLAREQPLKEVGAKRFMEMADKIGEYKDEFWQKAHEEPIGRHADMPFDAKSVADKALSEIKAVDRRANPGGARLAERWVRQAFEGDMTLKEADELVRRLNEEIKELPEKYGPIGERVRSKANQALRDQIDAHLEEAGEQGIKANNRSWGAMRNIEARLRERGPGLEQAHAREPFLPDWIHLYAFIHPGSPMSWGLGLRHLGRILQPSEGGRLGAATTALGKTGLEPPEITTPPYVGRPPRALLPPGPEQMPSGEPGGPSRVAGVEPMREMQRGPGGRMQRIYTGEPGPGMRYNLPAAGKAAAPEFTLGSAEEPTGFPGSAHEIYGGKGERLGNITVEPSGKTLKVHMLEGEFGSTAIRNLRKLLKGEYPEAETISFDRIRKNPRGEVSITPKRFGI